MAIDARVSIVCRPRQGGWDGRRIREAELDEISGSRFSRRHGGRR
jgi:hypothetical protein